MKLDAFLHGYVYMPEMHTSPRRRKDRAVRVSVHNSRHVQHVMCRPPGSILRIVDVKHSSLWVTMVTFTVTCPSPSRHTKRNAPSFVLLGVLVTMVVYESVLRSTVTSYSRLYAKSHSLGQPLPKEIQAPYIDPKANIPVPAKVESPKKKKKKIWKKPILTMKFDGRLGNQMFEFAAIHAIARMKGMKVYLNASHPINRLFHIDDKFVVRKPCGGFANVEVSCCDYNASLVDGIQRNICQRIFGYFQSWRYFEPYIESIRKQFVFQRSVVWKAQNKLRSLVRRHKKYPFKSNRGKCVLTRGRNPSCTFIAVHVRRGDLMLPIRIKQGRLPAPREYYFRAMNFFRKKYKNALFIIGSDSQDWAEENFAGPDALVSRDMLPEVDLSLLSQCNHTIMSVGTFGWWVSFLSKGTTVYYNKPFAANTSAAEAYTRYDRDFARPGWIGMA